MDAAPTQPVIDRHGLEVLSTDDCWSLLESVPIGRIAFVKDGEPVVLPVSFVVAGRRIAFRTARGAKFGAAVMHKAVAFEVDDWRGEDKAGWSVLVSGTAELVVDADECAELDAKGLAPWTPQTIAADWIRILPNEISGRRIVGP